MLYLYDNNRLKPLKVTPRQAIDIAGAKNTILVSNSINEMVEISHYRLSAFLIHKKNSLSIFKYWYLQLKNLTLEEFRIILFADKKNSLFVMLKIAATMSFGNYKLINFKKHLTQNKDRT